MPARTLPQLREPHSKRPLNNEQTHPFTSAPLLPPLWRPFGDRQMEFEKPLSLHHFPSTPFLPSFTPFVMRLLLSLCLAALLPLSSCAEAGTAPRQQEAPADARPPAADTAVTDASAAPAATVAATAAPSAASGAGQQEQLSGALIITPQLAAYDIFYRSPPQFPPRISSTTKVYQGQHVVVYPFFGAMALSPEGRANVSYDVSFFEPDGKLHYEDKDLVAIDATLQQTTQATGVFMPQAYLGFVAEENDPLGEYTFRATLRDKVSGQTKELIARLDVVAYEPVALPEGFDAGKWMTNYYLLPQPEFALAAFYELLKGVPPEKVEETLAPAMGFYNRLLTDNPWLLPSFAKRAEQAFANPDSNNEHAENALLVMLGYHLRNTATNPGYFSPSVWQAIREFAAQDWTLIDPGENGTITLPGQLDYLWGEFFASAAYKPVWQLIAALTPPSPDQLPLPLQQMPQARREELTEAIAKAAAWSLLSNAQQHRLVRAYIIGSLQAPDYANLPEDSVKILKELLRPNKDDSKDDTQAEPQP